MTITMPSERSQTLRDEINKQEPFDSASQEAYLNLVRTASELGGEFHALFKASGLSDASYNVLRILRGRESQLGPSCRGVRATDISADMVVRVPDVTRLVDRLVERGLAERARCTDDRRVVYVKITPEGRRLLESLDGPVVDLHERQLSHMTGKELAQLNALLCKARERANDA